MSLLERLYEYYLAHPEEMPGLYVGNIERDGVARCVCDYISGMSDRYAIETYRELFIPKVWRKPTV
jgi:dGTPase